MDRVELLAVGREADDVVAGEDPRHLAHPLHLLDGEPAQDAVAGDDRLGRPPRESSASAASRWAAIGRASATVSTRPSSIAEKKVRSPFGSTFWMARTWCWPPTRTTIGWAAKMKGESWSGSLPTSRAYSRAAGSALISRTTRALGIGVGDHHLDVGRLEVVELEDPDRAAACAPASAPRHPRGSAPSASTKVRRKSRPSPAEPPKSGIAPSAEPQRRDDWSSRRDSPSTAGRRRSQSQPGARRPEGRRAAARRARRPGRGRGRASPVDERGPRLEEARRGSRGRRSRPRRSRGSAISPAVVQPTIGVPGKSSARGGGDGVEVAGRADEEHEEAAAARPSAARSLERSTRRARRVRGADASPTAAVGLAVPSAPSPAIALGRQVPSGVGARSRRSGRSGRAAPPGCGSGRGACAGSRSGAP